MQIYIPVLNLAMFIKDERIHVKFCEKDERTPSSGVYI